MVYGAVPPIVVRFMDPFEPLKQDTFTPEILS